MGGFSVGWGRGNNRWGKVQGIRSINGGYKIYKGSIRIVKETEKPKNLYVQSMDMK